MNTAFIRKTIKCCCNLGLLNMLGDRQFISIYYWSKFGRFPDLDNPITYNEKLQWLKLNDRKEIYSIMVDKYSVRDYVSKRIGERYLVPLYGVWDSPDEIDFDTLPNRFVLKWTHDSGSVIVCKNKDQLDVNKVIRFLQKKRKRDVYKITREWPYKDVVPRIIAEEYLCDSELGELRDYKIYLFNGVAKMIMVNTGRGVGKTTADYFDADYNWLDFRWGYPNSSEKPQKPQNFELMKDIACNLGNDLIEGRIDFYEVNGQVYFGEITFFDGGGFSQFEPEIWDRKLGGWLKMPYEIRR